MSALSRRGAVVALVLAAPIALTGCFGFPTLPGAPGAPGADSDQQAEELVEGIIEQMGEESGGDFDMSAGELPEGWPASIPVTGTPTSGFSFSDDTGTGWNANTEATGTVDSVMAEIDAQLRGAGFESEFGGFYESAAFSVLVVSFEQDGVIAVSYTVTTK